MEAEKTGLLKFLREPKQLVLSNNVSSYIWDEEKCNELWEYVVCLAQDDSIEEYYMGAIMILEKWLFCTY